LRRHARRTNRLNLSGGANLTLTLLGDIGGTNSRFALNGPSGRPERVLIIENDSVVSLEAAIAHYLERTQVRPDAAVLAVAAPLDGRRDIELTNRDWRFRRRDLADRFGFSRLRLVNDFEAIGWALSRISSEDARILGNHIAPGAGPKAVLGPGTGLGVAALVSAEGRSFVVSSEGGHVSFGPRHEDEVEVFRRLMHNHGVVSAETVVSGPGLVRLAGAVDPARAYEAPEAVVKAALAGEATAKATVQLFVRLLGRFAGDIALVFKAFGGVYIAGGVASRLGALLDEWEFRAAFEAHPPHEGLLKGIPTFLMTRSQPGLLGCAVLADAESMEV
jgi:glucokinase